MLERPFFFCSVSTSLHRLGVLGVSIGKSGVGVAGGLDEGTNEPLFRLGDFLIILKL